VPEARFANGAAHHVVVPEARFVHGAAHKIVLLEARFVLHAAHLVVQYLEPNLHMVLHIML
jgi:hypothetical protein